MAIDLFSLNIVYINFKMCDDLHFILNYGFWSILQILSTAFRLYKNSGALIGPKITNL